MGPQTVRPATDRPTLVRTVRELYAKTSTYKMDRTKDTQELVKNTKNTWAARLLADHPPRPCGLSARRNPVARARPLEGQNFLPFARSPKSTKGKLPNHR
jgi:hypothetical protein